MKNRVKLASAAAAAAFSFADCYVHIGNGS